MVKHKATKPNARPAAISLLQNGLTSLLQDRGYQKIALEIGCGDGGFLQYLSEANPDTLYLGIEIDYTYACKAARNARNDNAIVFCLNAHWLKYWIAERGAFDDIWINFPDPWPKAKHQERRLNESGFVDHVGSMLAQGGNLHLATDVPDYAPQLRAALDHSTTDQWQVIDPPQRGTITFKTKYQQRWESMGKPIHYLQATLIERTPRQAAEVYTQQEINTAMQQPATQRAYGTEYRRDEIISRWISSTGKKIAVARRNMPANLEAHFTYDDHGQATWTNLDNWVLSKPEVDAIFKLLAIQPPLALSELS